MLFPATIVAQTDPSRLTAERTACAPIPVGLVRWPSGPRTSVVVKARYVFEPTISDDALDLATVQPALEARDFVIAKPACDVVVLGHAHSAVPQERIPCAFRIAGAFARRWSTSATALSTPLADDTIHDVTGLPGEPVGWPAARRADARGARQDVARELDDAERAELARLVWPDDDEVPEVATDEDDLDLVWDRLMGAGPPLVDDGVQLAAHAMTCAWLGPGGMLELEGLTPGGAARRLALPRHFPVVIYEAAGLRYDVPVALDTLVVDTDGSVTLTWRGQLALDALGQVGHRLVVSLEDVDALRPLVVIYGELRHGHFFRAATLPEQHAAAPEPDVDLRVAPLRAQGFARRYDRAIRKALARVQGSA